MPYLSASAVVIHYEEALYQVYAPLPQVYAPVAAPRDINTYLSLQVCLLILCCYRYYGEIFILICTYGDRF